ncbi:MAG: SEC-C metal-binding domain-containing protein [Planctomycetota bacterium]
MPDKIPLSQEDLKRHLGKQVDFLETSADLFDKGAENEATRLATTIRILVHDTSQSHSLLSQLNKKGIKFLDSSSKHNQKGLSISSGFVGTGMVSGKYVAMLDDLPPDVIKWVDFDTWWNMPIITDRERNQLTRKTIILTAANQDGGAHIDPELDKPYHDLSRKNSLGWTQKTPMGWKQLQGGDKVVIRQIAHELLKSLKPGYSKKPLLQTTPDIIIGEVTVGISTPLSSDKIIKKNKKIGRNEFCPCGSKKKYKYCCGK